MDGKTYITECPRDAMQGVEPFIETQVKADYINLLLQCGFDVIDFGSFVSPKAIPQMRDTAEVLKKLNFSNTSTEILAIIANERGAQDACSFDEITYLGYPFSVSETFQMRNTNATLEQSLKRVEKISEIASQSNKKIVMYLSMAFGNPYDDPWSAEIVGQWAERLVENFEIDTIALSDTIGSSTPEVLKEMFEVFIHEYPNTKVSAHLHSTPENAIEKINAAYQGGCRRFDGAIAGYGGCPMAKDDLTGNIPTETLVSYLKVNNLPCSIEMQNFQMALELFPNIIP